MNLSLQKLLRLYCLSVLPRCENFGTEADSEIKLEVYCSSESYPSAEFDEQYTFCDSVLHRTKVRTEF